MNIKLCIITDGIRMTYINKGFENNHILKTLSLNNNYVTKK